MFITFILQNRDFGFQWRLLALSAKRSSSWWNDRALLWQTRFGQPKRAWTTETRKSNGRPQKTTAKEEKLLIYRRNTDRDGGGPAYYIKNLTQNTKKLLTTLF